MNYYNKEHLRFEVLKGISTHDAMEHECKLSSVKEILANIKVNQKKIIEPGIVLSKEIKATKSEAMNEIKVNCNRHIILHPINEELVTVKSMSAWIKKARVFRANARNRKKQTCGI